MSSSTRILLSLIVGLAMGIALAAAAPAWLDTPVAIAEPIGRLWLDALRMTIVPLVFSLLVTGIASTAATASAGGLAARTLLLFAVVLFVSALFGEAATGAFLAVWPIPPAAADAMRASLATGGALLPAAASVSDWLGAIMPTNPIKAAADGDMLPLVIFALIFGFAVTRIQQQQRKTLTDFFQAVLDTMLVIVHWVIWVAPVGVFALAFVVGARAGIAAAGALAHYLILLVAIQALLIALIYPLTVLFARLPLHQFARAVAPAQAVAASTQSSLASLPAMIGAAQRLRIAAPVSALVLPLAVSVFRITGPPANLAVVLYSASLFGVDLSLGQFIAGAAIAVVMSFAAVGLPGQISFFTSIVPICVIMGVPVGALPLLLAVETVPDIFRTIGNVTADVAATAVMARHAEAAGTDPAPGEGS
ncbi:MAG: cation:dicarboxylase symporter family transporter [Arenimonas sp.]|jgi:Na+/H+-dicarboxylate symporter